MAAKKKVVESLDGPGEIIGSPDAGSPVKATGVGPSAVGTVIKEYVQNGHRYKRVVTENGGTVDVRA